VELMTAKELSRYLKLNEITIYKYAQEGKIPGFRIGSQWRFDRGEIDDFLRRNRPKARSASSRAEESGLQTASPGKVSCKSGSGNDAQEA